MGWVVYQWMCMCSFEVCVSVTFCHWLQAGRDWNNHCQEFSTSPESCTNLIWGIWHFDKFFEQQWNLDEMLKIPLMTLFYCSTGWDVCLLFSKDAPVWHPSKRAAAELLSLFILMISAVHVYWEEEESRDSSCTVTSQVVEKNEVKSVSRSDVWWWWWWNTC